MVRVPRKLLAVAALALSSSLVLLTVHAFTHSKIEHRLAAEHLNRARAACGYESGCVDPEGAMEELRAIPNNVLDRAEAEKILRIENQRLAEEEMRLERLLDPQDESILDLFNGEEGHIDRAVSNFQGVLHDKFACKKNPDGRVSVSFDYGEMWWKDDGRCAKRMGGRYTPKLIHR